MQRLKLLAVILVLRSSIPGYVLAQEQAIRISDPLAYHAQLTPAVVVTYVNSIDSAETLAQLPALTTKSIKSPKVYIQLLPVFYRLHQSPGKNLRVAIESVRATARNEAKGLIQRAASPQTNRSELPKIALELGTLGSLRSIYFTEDELRDIKRGYASTVERLSHHQRKQLDVSRRRVATALNREAARLAGRMDGATVSGDQTSRKKGLSLRLFSKSSPPVFEGSSSIARASSASIRTGRLETRKIIEKNKKFTTNRNLHEYAEGLGGGFLRFLHTLKPAEAWLDAGMGDGQALSDFILASRLRHDEGLRAAFPRLTVFNGANVTGVTVKLGLVARINLWDREYLPKGGTIHQRPTRDSPSAVKILTGRYIEGIPDRKLGRFRLITDVFGPLSYSDRLDEVLAKYLRILEKNGRIYTHSFKQAAQASRGRLEESTIILDQDGSRLSFLDYLRRIEGIDLVDESRVRAQLTAIAGEGGFGPPKVAARTHGGSKEAVVIRKVSNSIQVPKLKLISLGADPEQGGLPRRVFQIVEPAPDSRL